MPNVLSLFSGVGGFDLGLEAAGWHTVFFCEWDKHAKKVLERRWPDVPKWDDVSTLTAEHILSIAPLIDVVAWGSPCQDLSVAGRRAGLQGERSGLFHQGVRIIKEMREATNGKYPRVSLWENVVGALSSRAGADFGEVLHEMDEVGACFSEWRVLDAQYFGVPQRRRRVFLVSVFDPATAARCPDSLLPLEEGVRGDTSQGTTTRESATAEAFRGTTTNDGVILIDRSSFSSGVNFRRTPYIEQTAITPTVISSGPHAVAFDEYNFAIGGDVHHSLRSTRHSNGVAVAIGIQGTVIGRQDHNGPGGKGHTEDDDPMFTLTATDRHAVAVVMRQREGKPGGGKGPLMSEEKSLTLGVGNDQTLFVDAFIGSSDAQYTEGVGTLRAHGGDLGGGSETLAVGSSMTVRRLTPLECERLMGWPDGHTDGQADTHRYKQCGNGVASPVAEWLARCIGRYL